MSASWTGQTRVAERPPVEITTGRTTVALRWGSVVLAAVASTALVLSYFALPEVVPTHFGVTGEPDAWGPRWSVLVMAALMTAIVVGVAVLSRFPRVLNYPAPVTAENAQRLYREGERMLVWCGLGTAVTFTGMALLAMGLPGIVVVALGLVGLFVGMAAGVVRMSMVADAQGR